MLKALGFKDLDAFLSAVVPANIFDSLPPVEALPRGCTEASALAELRGLADANQLRRSLIGLGYYDTVTPAVIQRQVLENPSWYTAYTPYQAEIAQGRLEALFNFQTLISELTGLPIANASLLDEGTAAAEAMGLSLSTCRRQEAKRFLVDAAVLPQTLAVLQTRALPIGVELEVVEPEAFRWGDDVFGVLLQLPGRCGRLWDPSACIAAAHDCGALVTVAVDPLAQVLLAPVGELGADIAVGSTQRFGVPMGGGGPHAAFFCHPRCVSPPGAWPDCRPVSRCGWPASVSVGLADARAAHPTRQSHKQYLYGPSAARCDGLVLCHPSRS
jgi:glycine dehydrogenase